MILIHVLVYLLIQRFGHVNAFAGDLIHGGMEVRPANKYPWMVTINYHHFLCGGALISKTYVLTAAHCIKRYQGDKPPADENGEVRDARYLKRFRIGVGVHEKSQPEKQMKVSAIILHFMYGKGKDDDNFLYDIALIKVDNPVEFSDTIQPICLPHETTPDEPKVLNELMSHISGWGRTETSTVSKVLMEARVPVWRPNDCIDAYNMSTDQLTLMNQLVCAGNGQGINACEGDSGSPLFVAENGIYYAIGVTSKGPSTCGDVKPVVYTRVSKYSTWIRSYATDINDHDCGKSKVKS